LKRILEIAAAPAILLRQTDSKLYVTYYAKNRDVKPQRGALFVKGSNPKETKAAEQRTNINNS